MRNFNRKNYKPGEKYIVDGTPLHNGSVVTIVDWDNNWRKFDPIGYEEGKFKGETVLIPCFDPQFPETMYWWIAPWQLKSVE